uniref:Uncharacterized protein n=1 Tax=Panagrolaimus davidi TaxID=227884 RepID=A0A914QE21_9BILA
MKQPLLYPDIPPPPYSLEETSDEPEIQHSQPPLRTYRLREKGALNGDDFKVIDVFNKPKFRVRRNFTIFSRNFVIEDMNRMPLIIIKQDKNRFSTFNFISVSTSQNLARMKRKYVILRPKFEIDSVYGQYILEGDSFGFTLSKNGQNVVAIIRKKMFSWTNRFDMDISEEEDIAFITSIVVVLDQVVFK